MIKLPVRRKCSHSELFWSVFFHIRTEYGEILRISPYSVRMWEIAEQKKYPFSLRHLGVDFLVDIKNSGKKVLQVS